MHLALTTFGSYLRKKGELFVVEIEDQKVEISCKKVESIQIHTGAYFSTDAIKLALDNNIDIVFLDKYGNPYGRVWHTKLGSTGKIRLKQLKLSASKEGVELAKKWVSRKFKNQADFLKELASHRPEKRDKIEEYLKYIDNNRNILQNIHGEIEEVRGEIMGLEGSASRIYFDCLSTLLPERYEFLGRSRMPAKDGFNCYLNYGYGVLYSMVEKGCILAGLDPFLGFIHSDNYNKKSLVFDLIEPFRSIVDKTVFYLHSSRKVNQGQYDEIKNGYTLNKEGKKLLIENLNERFDTKVRFRNKNMMLRNTIQAECHHIANIILKMDI